MQTFYVDTTPFTGGRLLTSTTNTSSVQFGGFTRSDTAIPIAVQPRTVTAVDTTSADFDADDTFEFILGTPDSPPVAGTFTVTLGSTTTAALPWNISASDLQTALSAMFYANGKAECTVNQVGPGVWRATGNSNGALTTLSVTINASQLEPTSNGKIMEADLGSGSTPYSILIVLRQTALGYATPTTLITGVGRSGTLTVNTVEMYEYSQTQPGDTFFVPFSIRRTRDTGEISTIYGPVPCPIAKDSLNPLTAIPSTPTGTGLVYLTSGAPSVLTVGSGLTITGSTISASGGGDVTAAGNNTFTGLNQYGTLYLHSDFSGSGLGAISPNSDNSIAANGAIVSDSGSLVFVSDNLTFDIASGIATGALGGTMDFAAQRISTGWSFYDTTYPMFSLKDATHTKNIQVSTDSDDPNHSTLHFLGNGTTQPSLAQINTALGASNLQIENHYMQTGGVVTGPGGINATTNTFTYTAHAGSGAPSENYPAVINLISGTMPGNLAASHTYWFKNVTGTTFQLSDTIGGSAVDIQSEPTCVLNIGDRREEINWTVMDATGLPHRKFNITGGEAYYGFGNVWNAAIPFQIGIEQAVIDAEPTFYVTRDRAEANNIATTFLLAGTNSTGTKAGARLQLRTSGTSGITNNWILGAGGGGDDVLTTATAFSIYDQITQAHRLWVNSSGSVGIGNTNPTSKLDVTGTVTATAFSGSGAGLTSVNAATATLANDVTDDWFYVPFAAAATGSQALKTNLLKYEPNDNLLSVGSLLTTDGIIDLGSSGTAQGRITFYNTTSGQIDIISPAGALGSRVLTLPKQTGTFAVTTDITGGTLAGSFTTLAASGLGTFSAASAIAIKTTGAWATSGAGAQAQVLINDPTNTTFAGSASGTGLGINAATAFAGNLMDMQVNATSKLSVSSNGLVTSAGGFTTTASAVTTGAGTSLGYSFGGTHGKIVSISDGNILFHNQANSGFTSLNFGGSASPGWKITLSGTQFAFRATNDTVDASITAANITASGTLAVTGTTTFSSRANLASYTVATLPAAGAAGGIIYVSDAGGNGPCLAISNGTNWKRCDNTSTTVT